MTLIRFLIFVFFYILIGYATFWVWGILGVLQFFLVLHIYIAIFIGVSRLTKISRKKKIPSFKQHYNYFLSRFTGAIALGVLLIGGFCVYHNYIHPAKFPQVLLTNGNQKILFQTMSHIASESFYKRVRKMIHEKKQEGYVLYFEGVSPGSTDNSEKFSQALGVDIQNGLYEELSSLYGVVHQENEKFLGLVNNKDYNIDLSIDEVVTLYEAKIGEVQESKNTSKSIDLSPKIQELLNRLSKKELWLLQKYNQAILNMMMKNDWLRDILVNNFSNSDLFGVILDDRNRYVVQEILKRKDEKIIILYGLMHYEGILKELQKINPSWRVESIKYLQVIEP